MNRIFCSIIILASVISGDVTSAWAANNAASGILTEQTIRQLYIEHPDSCLDLLDKAELRKIDTDIPVFKMDMLRAMCYEIGKGACV